MSFDADKSARSLHLRISAVLSADDLNRAAAFLTEVWNQAFAEGEKLNAQKPYKITEVARPDGKRGWVIG